MKRNLIKILFSFLMLVFSNITNAQWGIKAGLNYNSNGELKEIPDNAENIIHGSGDKSAGYHVGVIRKIDLPIMFIKPELIFTKTKSSYDNEGDFEMSKLDLPIVLGFKMIGYYLKEFQEFFRQHSVLNLFFLLVIIYLL